MKRDQGHKYEVGQQVCAKVAPEVPLTVRRFVDAIYYCKVATMPDQREQVFFERELIPYASQVLPIQKLDSDNSL